MNSNYFDDVNDWLSVGGDVDLAADLTGQDKADTVKQLMAHGVTHVIDLRSEWSDGPLWLSQGLPAENHLYLPITDRWGYTPPDSWFEGVVDFVRQFWMDSLEGERLYVHCHMGINRAPSAAMLALLAIEPEMNPYDAFLKIREARPIAGLVYAESVGIWHLLNWENVEMTEDSSVPSSVADFSAAMESYWTPEMFQSINRGIAYFRDQEGGTLVVKA